MRAEPSAGVREAESGPAGRLLAGTAIAGALDGFGEAVLLDRLQQVVHRLQAKGFDGVLIKGCHENEMWQRFSLLPQLADHAHAVQAGHLYVQKHEIRLQLLDQIDGF